MERMRIVLGALAVLLLCAVGGQSTGVCLGAEGGGGDAVGIVLDILKSGDQEMQAVAIAMVKDMPGAEVTKALAKELPNLSPMSQVQLLAVLGDRGDAAALDAAVAV